ncbi:MAG: hypothetical protein WAV21_03690 [Minisyncoccia bacterium]
MPISWAADPAEHSKHHDQYRDLVRPDTSLSCCSDKDCQPVPYRASGGAWGSVFIKGEWIPVDPQKVLKNTNIDGQAHACFPENGTAIYCIILPPTSAQIPAEMNVAGR